MDPTEDVQEFQEVLEGKGLEGEHEFRVTTGKLLFKITILAGLLFLCAKIVAGVSMGLFVNGLEGYPQILRLCLYSVGFVYAASMLSWYSMKTCYKIRITEKGIVGKPLLGKSIEINWADVLGKKEPDNYEYIKLKIFDAEGNKLIIMSGISNSAKLARLIKKYTLNDSETVIIDRVNASKI
jgi:hypothetical protein